MAASLGTQRDEACLITTLVTIRRMVATLVEYSLEEYSLETPVVTGKEIAQTGLLWSRHTSRSSAAIREILTMAPSFKE